MSEVRKCDGVSAPVAKELVEGQADNPLRTIATVPNLISFLRLLLIPVFFVLLFNNSDPLPAFIVYAIAASTDWIDGQIARRTNTVSRFGQVLDPFIDRLLIASGVLGVFLVGRVPAWIVIVLIARDLYLMAGFYAIKVKTNDETRIPVMYLGKVTTTFLFVGFASLLLNWPLIPGLDIIQTVFLPGWGVQPAAMGIWFLYVSLILSITTAIIYSVKAKQVLDTVRQQSVG